MSDLDVIRRALEAEQQRLESYLPKGDRLPNLNDVIDRALVRTCRRVARDIKAMDDLSREGVAAFLSDTDCPECGAEARFDCGHR